jgi:hypothetical protein
MINGNEKSGGRRRERERWRARESVCVLAGKLPPLSSLLAIRQDIFRYSWHFEAQNQILISDQYPILLLSVFQAKCM